MSDRTDLSHDGTVDRRRRLGAAIRNARAGRSQTELGRAVSRPQSSISAWEAGTVDLPVERVSELEMLLGLAPGTLLVEAGYVSTDAARALLRPQRAKNKDNQEVAKKKISDYIQLNPMDATSSRSHPADCQDNFPSDVHHTSELGGQRDYRRPAVPTADRDFVVALVDWLFAHRPLLEALALIREMDPSASAITAISQLRKVAELRTSWELWEHISRRSSNQIREIIERELAPSTVDLIRFAIWNDPPRYTQSARRLDE